MASLNTYSTEPATKGKVVLHTSLGPLDVELWPKEAPKACRNFVQLCLEGYYDGCPFHRVIKDFMAQTGDPTGTGQGGESVYGAPFPDEFHGRLRFTHRGIVAMANDRPNANGAQFFVTLDRCDWLDRRHTIFGKITGESIYNLNRFNDLQTGADDRPEFPPSIERTEVLHDPFEDIVPRALPPRPKAEARQAEEDPSEARRRKRMRKKNTSLLSFGDEEDGADAAGPSTGRPKSLHEAAVDPRLSAKPAVEVPPDAAGGRRGPKDAVAAPRPAAAAAVPAGAPALSAEEEFAHRMRHHVQEAGRRANGGLAADEVRGEYEKLKRELARDTARDRAGGSGWKWRGKGAEGPDSDDDDDRGTDGAGASAEDESLEARRKRYLAKSRQMKGLGKKDRAQETFLKLQMFQRDLPTTDLAARKLEAKPPSMAEGRDDMYVTTDPLEDPGRDNSRALEKIRARQQQLAAMESRGP